MVKHKFWALTAGLVATMSAAGTVRADILFDYADIRISFDAGTGDMTVTDHAATSLKATLRDSNDVAIDRADIAAGLFDFLLDTTVVDGGGADDLSITGTIDGTDKTTATSSYSAAFMNAPFGPDLDGVTFFAGTLTIRGTLSAIGTTILVGPAGDWIFEGTSDAPTGVGADGVADQFTVAAVDRPNHTRGSVFVLETSIPFLGDGTSTAGIGNADDFFAAAFAHDGFASDGGDMKVTIIPAPGAAVLGVIGMGMVGWVRRAA